MPKIAGWDRNPYGEEGSNGIFGPNSEVVKHWNHDNQGEVRIEKYETPKEDPRYYVALLNPPEFTSERKYDTLKQAENRAMKYMKGKLR